MQIDLHAFTSQQGGRIFATLDSSHMAPSFQKALPMSVEKRRSSPVATLAHPPATEHTRFMIPSTVHTHMYASVVNAEAAAEAACHALRTAEAIAAKASEAAEAARAAAAAATAAEEQALRDVALCKAATAIANEHHDSTMRNLLQLPRPQADPKGEYAVPVPVPTAAAAAAAAAPPRTPASDGQQDALAIAAATAVARACIQQHMERRAGAAAALQEVPCSMGLPRTREEGGGSPARDQAAASPASAEHPGVTSQAQAHVHAGPPASSPTGVTALTSPPPSFPDLCSPRDRQPARQPRVAGL